MHLKATSRVLVPACTEIEKMVGAAGLGVGRNQEFSFRVTFDSTETQPGGGIKKTAE